MHSLTINIDFFAKISVGQNEQLLLSIVPVWLFPKTSTVSIFMSSHHRGTIRFFYQLNNQTSVYPIALVKREVKTGFSFQGIRTREVISEKLSMIGSHWGTSHQDMFRLVTGGWHVPVGGMKELILWKSYWLTLHFDFFFHVKTEELIKIGFINILEANCQWNRHEFALLLRGTLTQT